MKDVRKYYCKSNWYFNLDSMRVLLLNRIDDIYEGEYEYLEVMGKKMNVHELEDFVIEIEHLMDTQGYRVTSKEFGRIKVISDERNMIRYCTCLNKGLSEESASHAFFD